MTGEEIFRELRPLVVDVTGRKIEEVRMESVLVEDLGAESIDLVDLSFLIEEKFGVTIEANEFERRVRARFPGGAYEKDGFLTAEAIAGLREELPEVDPGKLREGLRKADLPALLTVSVFVGLIGKKLAAKMAAEASGETGETRCRS
jgi:acyl carrier protein